MVRSQSRRGPNAVHWALPDEEVGGPVTVLRLVDVDLDPDDTGRPTCPECEDAEPMLSAITRSGERYDLCLGCRLLWHVDRERGVVEGVRWLAPVHGEG